METLIQRLSKAKRPLILAGHGVRASGSVKRFRAVVKALNIPVVTTQLACDLMAYKDPLYIGSPGVKGDRAGGLAVQNADVLLIMGCSLHATTTGYELDQFAPHAFKILVDIDRLVLKKNESIVNHTLHLSVQELLTFLLVYADRSHYSNWKKECLGWKEKYDLKNESNRTSSTPEINYYDVIDLLGELLPDDATLIADAGSAFFITGQAFRARRNQRVILPGGLAQMGYATGAMVGACFAGPQSLVVGLIGDGSIQTNIHDLGVLSYHRLNAKILLLNNRGYSCIRNTQDRYFKSYYSGVDEQTGVSSPLFRDIAQAYSMPYLHCKSKLTLRARLREVLETPGPFLFEISTKTNQEIQPTVQSEVLADGTMKSHGLDHMFPYLNS